MRRFLLKSPKTDKKIKKTALLFPVVFAVMTVFSIFFEDRDIVFDCRKQDNACAYYHSTIADKSLRYVRSYDISDVIYLELQEKVTRSGKSRRRHYEIFFHTDAEDGGFSFPKNFSTSYSAQEQIGKLNAFLHSKEPRYVYQERPTDDMVKTVYIPLGGSLFAMMIVLLVGRLKGNRPRL